MSYIIYKIINIKTNEFYIGKTKCSLSNRINRHYSCAYNLNQHNQAHYNQKFQSAIRHHIPIKNRIEFNKTFISSVLFDDLTINEAKSIENILIVTLKPAYNENFGTNHSNATKNKLSKAKQGLKNPQAKPVFQYDKQGNFIKKWDYITLASKAVNGNKTNISACARDKIKSAYGFIWRYEEM